MAHNIRNDENKTDFKETNFYCNDCSNILFCGRPNLV